MSCVPGYCDLPAILRTKVKKLGYAAAVEPLPLLFSYIENCSTAGEKSAEADTYVASFPCSIFSKHFLPGTFGVHAEKRVGVYVKIVVPLIATKLSSAIM
jgi:hypothetical protein